MSDSVFNGTWVCDRCYGPMDVSYESRNRYLVHCPNCGQEWYIDGDGECINDDNYDDIPECCVACGGPYPDCQSSCSIFDD